MLDSTDTSLGEESVFEKGFNYLIYEDRSEITFKVFDHFIENSDIRSLCLTTSFPDKLKKVHKLEGVEILWISEAEGKGAMNPKRLDFEINRQINKFMKSEGESVVLMDCFEFLSLSNGFEKVGNWVIVKTLIMPS